MILPSLDVAPGVLAQPLVSLSADPSAVCLLFVARYELRRRPHEAEYAARICVSWPSLRQWSVPLPELKDAIHCSPGAGLTVISGASTRAGRALGHSSRTTRRGSGGSDASLYSSDSEEGCVSGTESVTPILAGRHGATRT